MKTLLLVTLAAAGLGVTAGAQTLTLIDANNNNGSFETSPAAQTLFTTPASATAAIPYWGASAADDNSGVTGGNTIQAGLKGGFLQPGGAAFNLVTTRSIQAGDVFTLTFFAFDSGGGVGPLTATLFSQAIPGATYAFAPANTFGTLATPLTTVFTQYTLTATATAADVGGDVGINITNNGAATFNSIDNFVLTVTPAAGVPEPSTYAMLAAGGLGMMMMVFRRRQA